MPWADPVADGTDEHQAFEHRRSCEGDEADARRDGERQAHDPEPEDTADAGEEDAAENHQGVADRVKREVEEAQNEGEGQRHDDEEPPLGSLHVLELPAPVEVVAAIELHLSPNPLLGFLHE